MKDHPSNHPEFIFTCTKCGVQKPNKEYVKRHKEDQRRRRRYSSSCKRCQNERVKKWQYCSVRRKDYILRRKYNITLQQFKTIYAKQNGCCAICGVSERKLRKNLAVDHCHTTGAVRGLLCGSCNTAIGSLKDNLAIVYKAADYLEQVIPMT